MGRYFYFVICIFILCVLVLCLIIGTGKPQYSSFVNVPLPQSPNMIPDEKCVCVFDIDGTLCGKTIFAMEECKKSGCRIALNTARPSNYLEDIDIEKWGLKYLSEEDHYFNPNSYSQTLDEIANTKAMYLRNIELKYKIKNPKCIILFDDLASNIKASKNAGYSTILASHDEKCGISESGIVETRRIVSEC